MRTYYTPEEERELVVLIEHLKNEIPKERRETYPTLNDLFAPEEMGTRFHDCAFMAMPARLLMLGETLYAAQQEGWQREQAKDDEHYYEFTERIRKFLSMREVENLEKMHAVLKHGDEAMNREMRAHVPHERSHIELLRFVPAHHLTREEDEAYVMYMNRKTRATSGNVYTSNWSTLLIERGQGYKPRQPDFSDFYNPEFNTDMNERKKLRRLFAKR